ncbi:MAG: hypothetical protein ACXVX8_01365 [Blastococcus sp.]
MAELRVEGDELVLELSALEKLEGLHGDIRVPMAAVRGVEALDDVIHEVHGLRLPGSRWPGKLAVGRIVGRGMRTTFAAIHADTPRGVRVQLAEASFDELLVGCADPELVKRTIEARR